TGSLRGAGAGCLPEILQLPPQEEGHLLPRTAPLPTAVVRSPRGWPGHTPSAAGSVSKVEMVTPMALIYKVLFPSLSTFETPPSGAGGHARHDLGLAQETRRAEV